MPRQQTNGCRLSNSVFSVGSGGFYHGEDVFKGGVAAALVAGGENKPAALCGVVNRLLRGADNVLGRAGKHDACRVQVAFQHKLGAVLLFKAFQVTVAHGRGFKRVYYGQVGILGTPLDDMRFGAAGVDVGRNVMFLAQPRHPLDDGKPELVEDFGRLENQRA